MISGPISLGKEVTDPHGCSAPHLLVAFQYHFAHHPLLLWWLFGLSAGAQRSDADLACGCLVYANSHPHGHADAIAILYAVAQSAYRRSRRHPDACTDKDIWAADGDIAAHAGPVPDANAAAGHRYADGDEYSHADRDGHGDSHHDDDRHPHRHRHRYSNLHADADGREHHGSNRDLHADAYAIGDSWRYSDCHADADTHDRGRADGDEYAHAHIYTDAHRDQCAGTVVFAGTGRSPY